MDQNFLNDLKEVKRVLDAKYSAYFSNTISGEYEMKFMFCHSRRNKFNTAARMVRNLKQQGLSSKYQCNEGRIWTELLTIGNKYHMPEEQYTTAAKIGISKPWSRKFLSNDESDLKGEFELIVQGDSISIDGNDPINAKYQATYNFGRTPSFRHKALDVDPHKKSSLYSIEGQAAGDITILENNVIGLIKNLF